MTRRLLLSLAFVLPLSIVGCKDDAPAPTPRPVFRDIDPPAPPVPGLPLRAGVAPGIAAGSTPTGVASPASSPTTPTAKEGSGAAYFALSSGGLVKLEDGKFSRIGPPPKSPRKLALAPDGTLYAVGYGEVVRIKKGKAPQAIGNYNLPGSIDDVAASEGGKLAGISFQGIAHYDGQAWTKEEKGVLGPSASLLRSVAADKKGRIWIASANDLHVREGNVWRVVDVGKVSGTGRAFWSKLHVSPAGTLYAVHSSGILKNVNDAWSEVPLGKGIYGLDRIAQGPSEQLHVLSTNVLHLVPASGPPRAVPMEMGRANALAADAAGRTWLADDTGVTVIDAQGGLAKWAQGSVPELAARIDDIVVTAGGPTLPKVGPVATGAVAGKLLRGGAPVAGVPVEICASPSMFFKRTPCSGAAFWRTTTTTPGGEFRFDGVPLGTYRFAIKAGPKWTTTLMPCCSGMKKGQTFDVGAMTLRK